ncbi:unnamed protein product, partial [Lepidochelys kempii]
MVVDGDSGQNSWLSYQLLKATDPGILIVGLQNGEVKTTRPVTERDNFQQKLVILIRDNGKSPRSTTAEGPCAPGRRALRRLHADRGYVKGSRRRWNVDFVFSNLFGFNFLYFSCLCGDNCRHDEKYSRNVQGKIHCVLQEFLRDSNFSNTLLDITGTGTLWQSYRYEVCLTNGPGNSDFKFFQPLGSPLPVENGNVEVNPKTSLETQTNSNMLDGKDPVRG